jgi:hypothetical protein
VTIARQLLALAPRWSMINLATRQMSKSNIMAVASLWAGDEAVAEPESR